MNRREFLLGSAAAAAMASTMRLWAEAPQSKMLFAACGGSGGLRRYEWRADDGGLRLLPGAATTNNGIWIALDRRRSLAYVACETQSFDGKPTGGVVSLRVGRQGELTELARANSAGPGSCHCALDASGRVLVSADYAGGSAASFLCDDSGSMHPAWSEQYAGRGPRADRQEKAHAHWASFSPDNRFAYVNDLGSDRIHIYRVDHATAKLSKVGEYAAAAGAGPRTLHFLPGRDTAYVVNELTSRIDVVLWSPKNGLLTRVNDFPMLEPLRTGPTRGCDLAITRDRRRMYAINRDQNFLLALAIDPVGGALRELWRGDCGGQTPRHLALSPDERWLLIANQDSNRISVFPLDAKTGRPGREAQRVDAPSPMCLRFW